ncbi:MAG TPA: hypothetical protein DCQ26_01515 [Marinilabiliales bacterium]|nr:MAG: hypothetical protein A2W95_08460 [Bacteroidetes bacterium GWA2_40_14]OFX75876.1 MAG: hypothetical protein A2W96_05905 [Bacteroidetes bacterium GWD2_40_43]OFZ24737.1 MAG: hypothetical protein A2437_02545 [Bacteroidetes bacterium RIFOXYC2_FULL_40_12]HAM97261.1 hypothetical protein [Marinilabiliales bacterium]HBX85050.1 hypothetical protein [Marinilabiliales bacterium]
MGFFLEIILEQEKTPTGRSAFQQCNVGMAQPVGICGMKGFYLMTNYLQEETGQEPGDPGNRPGVRCYRNQFLNHHLTIFSLVT